MRPGLASSFFLLAAVMVCGLPARGESQAPDGLPVKPPAAPARPVQDVLHGQTIVDPYRWLETDSPETQAFQAAQLAYTRAYLDRVGARPALHKRLGELLAIGTVGAPEVRGQRLFYTRRDAGQNQPVLYARDGVSGRTACWWT
jgi:prolyl oligopeptidase